MDHSQCSIVFQPFFIFYASRLKETIRIEILNAPSSEPPEFSIIHHESKASLFSSNSSKAKERSVQVEWKTWDTASEHSFIYSFPLAAYSNEALRMVFRWPSGERAITKPIMITSSEQIMQALAKYDHHYNTLLGEEKIDLFRQLHLVEWKSTRSFETHEVSSIDSYFSGNLSRILSLLQDRMKLVMDVVRWDKDCWRSRPPPVSPGNLQSPELQWLWNQGYLMMCDDEMCRHLVMMWYNRWDVMSKTATATETADRLALLGQMVPKSVALRFKMSGKTPLAFTLAGEETTGIRHKMDISSNILSFLARADLQCLYNIKLNQVEMLEEVILNPRYREACPASEGFYAEITGSAWANLSFQTFNQLSQKNKELEALVEETSRSLLKKDMEMAALKQELANLKGTPVSTTPLTSNFSNPSYFQHQPYGVKVDIQGPSSEPNSQLFLGNLMDVSHIQPDLPFPIEEDPHIMGAVSVNIIDFENQS